MLTIDPITNVASIGDNKHNTNPNNTSSATLHPEHGADLAITKTVNDLIIVVGKNVLFILRVKNNGPNTAVNAFVYDVISSGPSYYHQQQYRDHTVPHQIFGQFDIWQ